MKAGRALWIACIMLIFAFIAPANGAPQCDLGDPPPTDEICWSNESFHFNRDLYMNYSKEAPGLKPILGPSFE